MGIIIANNRNHNSYIENMVFSRALLAQNTLNITIMLQFD